MIKSFTVLRISLIFSSKVILNYEAPVHVNDDNDA